MNNTPLKACEALMATSDDQIIAEWNKLEWCDPQERRDDGLSMSEWVEVVHTVMDHRGLPHIPADKAFLPDDPVWYL